MKCSTGDLGCRMGQVEQLIRYAYWNSGCKGFVIGMSGGVDSAVAAAFCCRAVGPDKVLGLSLPSQVSNGQDCRDAAVPSASSQCSQDSGSFPGSPVLPTCSAT
jgi:NH3-dependent NAD+ synthetase